MFVTLFGFSYIFSPKFCHRFVGYLEEEAVKTYTKCLEVSAAYIHCRTIGKISGIFIVEQLTRSVVVLGGIVTSTLTCEYGSQIQYLWNYFFFRVASSDEA